MLKKYRIGAILGANYGPKFQLAEQQGIIKVTRVTKALQNFKMLLRNRIDLMISPERVANHILKSKLSDKEQGEIESVLAIEEPVEYDYLLISKKGENGPYFFEAMNRGLKKLKKNGRYHQLVK